LKEADHSKRFLTLLPPTEDYDKEKYPDMLLDSAESVLGVFGFDKSACGLDNNNKKRTICGTNYTNNTRKILKQLSRIYNGYQCR
jgi:hypothetical protein